MIQNLIIFGIVVFVALMHSACTKVDLVMSEDLGREYDAGWYSECLKQLNEPRLKGIKGLVYRILILPTHGNAVAVRVERRGNL